MFSGYEDAKKVEIPDFGHLLPKEIALFTKAGAYDEKETHVSFIQGAGHEGSHSHLVHEFISAILEGRNSAIDSTAATNWTMAGVCAHESAMNNGKRIEVPQPK